MVLVRGPVVDSPEAARPGEEESSLADEPTSGHAVDEGVSPSAEAAGAEQVTRLSTDLAGKDAASIDASSGWQASDWINTSGSAASKWLRLSIGLAAGGVLTLGLIGFGVARWSTGPEKVSHQRAPVPLSAVMPSEETSADSLEALADTLPGVPSIDPVPALDDSVAAREPPHSDTGSGSTTTVENIPALSSHNTIAEPPNAGEVLPPGFAPRIDGTRQGEGAPPTFADLANLLEGPAAATDSAELPTDSVVDPDVSVPTPAAVASEAPRSSTSEIARTRDVSMRLGVKVRAAHFDQVPLIDFVRSMMRLSGTAMQVDPAALRQAGKDVESRVTYSANDVSVDQLLRQALGPLNLTPVIDGQIVRISSPFWEETRLRQMSFFIGDLQQGKGSDLDLAGVISKLIEPDTWSDVGGAGSIRATGELLKVNQTRRVQFQVLILLEKLRLARGLRPQSKIPARYILPDSRWRQLQPRLSRPIDVSAWHPQPFLDVVTQLEKATSDLRILVDWQVFASSDRMQDSACTLVARQTTVADVFDQLLTPRELELRPISESTVQITSASSNAARPYLEFYSLEELGESGLARLEESMHTHVGDFALDTASDTALVVLPASQHRDLLGR